MDLVNILFLCLLLFSIFMTWAFHVTVSFIRINAWSLWSVLCFVIHWTHFFWHAEWLLVELVVMVVSDRVVGGAGRHACLVLQLYCWYIRQAHGKCGSEWHSAAPVVWCLGLYVGLKCKYDKAVAEILCCTKTFVLEIKATKALHTIISYHQICRKWSHKLT